MEPIRRRLWALARSAAVLLWPGRCAACDAFVSDDIVFCDACVPSVLPTGAACGRCARPRDGDKPCVCGRRPESAVSSATAVFLYGGALSDAVLRFKHGGRRHVGRGLGTFLRPHLAAAKADVVVPVPLHPRRLRQRGFNQSLELVRGAGLPKRPGHPRLLVDALRRHIDTPSLGHEPPERRRTAVAGAFSVRTPHAVRGTEVLLVDDVLTTGATTNACAEALARAGAKCVHVLVLARAV